MLANNLPGYFVPPCRIKDHAEGWLRLPCPYRSALQTEMGTTPFKEMAFPALSKKTQPSKPTDHSTKNKKQSQNTQTPTNPPKQLSCKPFYISLSKRGMELEDQRVCVSPSVHWALCTGNSRRGFVLVGSAHNSRELEPRSAQEEKSLAAVT